MSLTDARVGRLRNARGHLVPQTRTVDEFWNSVLINSTGYGTDACWTWQGAHTKSGYAMATLNYKRHYLHRFAYERLIGAVPAGLELDHLCRNRGCFNPAHLEPVTHAENMRRGHWGRKTECPQGHPYDAENTRINASNGGRECRTCVRARKRAASAARRAAS